MEPGGHGLLADGPAHIPVPRRVGLHPEDGAERGQVLGLVVVVPALLVVVLQDLWVAATHTVRTGLTSVCPHLK